MRPVQLSLRKNKKTARTKKSRWEQQSVYRRGRKGEGGLRLIGSSEVQSSE